MIQRTQGVKILVLLDYISTLTRLRMLEFALLIVLLSCLSYLDFVNEVESHKKYRWSDLALEKYWVTQCGWVRLCATVAMGMSITNFWKLFYNGVKRYHYEKLIDIRELLERLYLDFFYNTFITDTRNSIYIYTFT